MKIKKTLKTLNALKSEFKYFDMPGGIKFVGKIFVMQSMFGRFGTEMEFTLRPWKLFS